MANSTTTQEATFSTTNFGTSDFMDRVRDEVIIQYSPKLRKEVYDALDAQAKALATEDKGHWEWYRELYNSMIVEVPVKGVSFRQAQAIAEPWRMANPKGFANIADPASNSFIGNTTWHDQMEMFWGYETFTPEGAAAAFARNEEAKALGIPGPSWE
jgi:hypothetical protein